MAKIAPASERIVFTLAEAAPSANGEFPMCDEDFQRMKTIPSCVRAIGEILGRTASWILCGSLLRLEIVPNSELDAWTGNALRDALSTTCEELKHNAAREAPLPHSIAVSRPGIVPVLRAVSAGHHKHHLRAHLDTHDGRYEIPILDPADFTEPKPDQSLRRAGTFCIVGVRRDDANGHCLIVTDSELWVRLPTASPWDWSSIRHVLDAESWIEGTLIRAEKGSHWQLEEGARLVTQQSLKP